MIIKKSTKTIVLAPEKLIYPTVYLPCYKELEQELALHGAEYIIIKKSIWYQLHSIPFQKVSIRLGNINTDCRVHVIYPMPSGSGKNNIINFNRKISKECDLKFDKPTSYHPEAIIGKTLRFGNKNSRYEEIPGSLADDVVMFNEAIEIFRGDKREDREIRKYLNEATDPYPHNEIVKRMTDLPREEALRYSPHCIIGFFIQPFWIYENVVLNGTLRRCIVAYQKNIKANVPVENYFKRVDGVVDYSNDFIVKLVEMQKELNNFVKEDFAFEFSEEAKTEIKKLHLELVKQGMSNTKKARNYTQMVDFFLQDRLVKLAAIQAGVHKRKKVEVEDVQKAFIDLTEFFACELKYINDKIMGNLDYGEGWQGAQRQDRACLQWLYSKGAINKEKSEITISEYVKYIANFLEKSESRARQIYLRYKDLNWINSEQIGQHSSKVWLTFIPNESQGLQGCKAYNLCQDSPYFKLVEKFSNNPNNPNNPQKLSKEVKQC